MNPKSSLVLFVALVSIFLLGSVLAQGDTDDYNEDDSESLERIHRPVKIIENQVDGELNYSDDDDGFILLDEAPDEPGKMAERMIKEHDMCRRCTKRNPNCEHGERKGSAKQRFHYSRADEKFLRQRVFWNGRWCLEHGSDQNLLNAFIGTEDEGNLCDPTPSKTPMCKNFVISPINPEELCYTATDLSCHSTTRKCEQKSPNIVWDGDVHFDAGNGCLNEAGREYYNSQVLPTLKNSEDGKRLHHEDCEPFSDEPADKRCMTVSKIAVNYQNRTTSRTSCWKPTNMKCDPIIKKCICGNDGNMTEIHFQYGNKSQICFLRPTMAWMPGYTCGGRSKASTIFDGTYVCQCKSSYYLPKFNDQCKKWWICKGAQITPTNFMIILFTFLAAIL